MLTYAFARDVIERIKVEPLRERLEQVLFERLHEQRPLKSGSFWMWRGSGRISRS